jgi:hypothetical protein
VIDSPRVKPTERRGDGAALDDHCRVTIRVNVDESFLTEAETRELERRIPSRIKRHLDRTELRAQAIANETAEATL